MNYSLKSGPHPDTGLNEATSTSSLSPSSTAAAARRPRAGTLPSTFQLGPDLTSSSSSPSGVHANTLLSPNYTNNADPRPDGLKRRLSGLPMNSSGTPSFEYTHTSPLTYANDSSSSEPHHLGEVKTELRASLLRASQPISPDPIASARLRSGSLTLPISGLGNPFSPGVFGPPGSWTPKSTSGLSTPLAMAPATSYVTGDPNFIASQDSATTAEMEHASASIGGILNFLNIDEAAASSIPSSSSLPIHPSSKTVPGLFAPGRRPSASSSVLSSSQPPIISNLRPTYHDHEGLHMGNGGLIRTSPVPAVTPVTAVLSPAARVRSSTVAAPDPLLRKASPFRHLTVSNGSSGSLYSPQISDPAAVSARMLADLALEENLYPSPHMYQAPGPSNPDVATASLNHSLVSTLHRPRASTIGILDEAALHSQQRKRAGTTGGPSVLNRKPKTPMYNNNANGGSSESEMLAALEDEAYATLDPWPATNGISHSAESLQNYHGQGFVSGQAHHPTLFASPSDRPGTPPPAQYSRSLWIGNIDTSVTLQDMFNAFGIYGQVESIRLLNEKECAFVK